MQVEEINWQELIDKEDKDRTAARLPVEPMHRGRRMPYVLFGAIEGRGTPEEGPTLFRLNLAANHAQPEMIRMYALDKGYKILKWWMPTSEQYQRANDQASKTKGGAYEDVQVGMWERLDNECRSLTGKDRVIQSKDEAIKALEEKVREYEKAEKKVK